MNAFELTIVIVNWNTRELLANCLRSIRDARPALDYKTVLIDNNSRDGSLEMVQKDFPECIAKNSGGNLGFGRASNIGAALADSEFVLFLNPDTEISAGALEKMIQKMRSDTEIGALGCKIRNLNGTIQQLGVQQFPTPANSVLKFLVTSEMPRMFQSMLPLHDPHESGYVLKLFGACLLVRRDVLNRIGAFDERFFMYCEDVDLCRRIHSAGWKLYYMSEVEILHLGACSSNQAPGAFSILMGCESLSLYMKKYYGSVGELGFRAALLVALSVRVVGLACAGLFRAIGVKMATPNLSASIRKHWTLGKWALGLERVRIAG